MSIRGCRAMRTMTFLVAIVLVTAVASEADQLFTNGAVTSVPGGGPGGTHASRLQNSLGMTTLGYGVDFADGTPSALAEDFKVTGPGWHITRPTFYGYQTSSGTTSTLKDLRFVIFNGRPDLPRQRDRCGQSRRERAVRHQLLEHLPRFAAIPERELPSHHDGSRQREHLAPAR